MKVAAFAAIAAALALAGCSSVREAKISENFQMNYDEVVPVRESIADGAIYSRANAGFFLGDRRAQRVGDLLTVTIKETMKAEKNDTSNIDRNGKLSISALPSFLFGANAAPLAKGLSSSTTSHYDGTGSASQDNNIEFKLSVVVTRVYENGNLWVQGQKQITLNQGEEYVRIAGIVRPEDIQPGNTVAGEKLAQAQISYTGSGSVNDATKEGWMNRIFGLITPI